MPDPTRLHHPFTAQTRLRCTCEVGDLCRSRGCHVLGGFVQKGFQQAWERGVTICLDCPLGEERREHA